MTKLDTRLFGRIYAIVQAKGKSLRFYNNAGTAVAYDPETGGIAQPTSAYEDVICTPPRHIKRFLQDGRVSATGEVRTIVPTKELNASFFSTNFDIGTRVDFDSTSWTVKSIGRLYTGNDIGAYDLVLGMRNQNKP